MTDHLPGIYQIERPQGVSSCVVFDSPHSGSVYPADFDYSCSYPLLCKAEDSYVDELFAAAPAVGAPFLKALFPRTYIDVNRALDDIDLLLIEGNWPGPVDGSGRSVAGHGLIRRLLRPGYSIYERKLSVDEVERRIKTCYLPYHAALGTLLDEAYANYGQVWHINCHSMPSSSAFTSPGMSVDITLGTRDGTTCDPAFAREMRSFLQQLGYRVSINNPYKGVELLRRYADPVHHRHSIQIEISKALYMNEEDGRKNKNFSQLQNDIKRLMQFICDYAAGHALPLAAD